MGEEGDAHNAMLDTDHERAREQERAYGIDGRKEKDTHKSYWVERGDVSSKGA